MPPILTHFGPRGYYSFTAFSWIKLLKFIENRPKFSYTG